MKNKLFDQPNTFLGRGGGGRAWVFTKFTWRKWWKTGQWHQERPLLCLPGQQQKDASRQADTGQRPGLLSLLTFVALRGRIYERGMCVSHGCSRADPRSTNAHKCAHACTHTYIYHVCCHAIFICASVRCVYILQYVILIHTRWVWKAKDSLIKSMSVCLWGREWETLKYLLHNEELKEITSFLPLINRDTKDQDLIFKLEKWFLFFSPLFPLP